MIGHYGNRLEIMAFGRIELMVTKDPTLKEGTLIDDRGKRFPVVRDPLGYAHILNSSDLFLLDFIYEMEDMGIESLGIDLRGRRQDLCELVSKAFSERDIGLKDKIKRKCGSITVRSLSQGRHVIVHCDLMNNSLRRPLAGQYRPTIGVFDARSSSKCTLLLLFHPCENYLRGLFRCFLYIDDPKDHCHAYRTEDKNDSRCIPDARKKVVPCSVAYRE